MLPSFGWLTLVEDAAAALRSPDERDILLPDARPSQMPAHAPSNWLRNKGRRCSKQKTASISAIIPIQGVGSERGCWLKGADNATAKEYSTSELETL
jgi:hypothetical protein